MQLDRIYNKDVLVFLRSLPDACANLIVADPPYNLVKDFGVRPSFKKLDQWLEWSDEWLSEAARILHPQGNIFVYEIHKYACYLQCKLMDIGLEYRRQIIWNYENGWSRYSNGPACHYEPILWFAKTQASTYHTIREPYKSKERLKHKITKNGRVWTPNPDGRQAGDVWQFPTLAGRRFAEEKVDHPTQKPLALTLRIVNHFSNPGDLVVVPFAGSGTECVASKMTGRHYLGTDLNPKYVEIARQRLKSSVLTEIKAI